MKNNKSIKEFLDLGGKNRVTHLFNISLNNLTTDEQEKVLAKLYWKLLTKSNLLGEVAYEFLIENHTYEEIGEELNRPETSLVNDTYRDVRKVFKKLHFDIYYQIKNKLFTEETKKEAFQYITTVLEESGYREESEDEDLSEHLIYPLLPPTEILYIENGIEEDKFIDTVNLLKFLSEPYLQELLKEIPNKYLRYIMYLLSADDDELSISDKQRKDIIKSVWWL